MDDTPNIPIIDYGGSRPAPGWMVLRTFANPMKAQFFANALEAHSIPCQVFGDAMRASLNMYGAMYKIDVQIHSDDSEQANAVIATLVESGRADLEPVEPEDASEPLVVTEDSGEPIRWLAVKACDSPAAMRETALTLEAAHLEVRIPMLAPRGAIAPRVGPRFVVRVRAEDADQAAAILNRPAAVGEDGEDPHCLKCGGWNVFEITHELKNILLGLFGLVKRPQCECLKCHYIGDREEFL